MIVSMNVSHFVKICQVLTIVHQLICRVVLILGHGVHRFIVRYTYRDTGFERMSIVHHNKLLNVK